MPLPLVHPALPTSDAGRGALPCRDNPEFVHAAVPWFGDVETNTGAVVLAEYRDRSTLTVVPAAVVPITPLTVDPAVAVSTIGLGAV